MSQLNGTVKEFQTHEAHGDQYSTMLFSNVGHFFWVSRPYLALRYIFYKDYVILTRTLKEPLDLGRLILPTVAPGVILILYFHRLS